MNKIPEGMMPEEAPPVPVVLQDEEKKAAIRAAVYYDRVAAEQEQCRRLVEQAKIALEVQIARLADVQKMLDAERTMHASTQELLNKKLQDCADLEAILADERDHHEHRAARLGGFEFSRLRKRNGKHSKRNGDTLSDVAGSEVKVDLDPSVLASGSTG